MHRRIKSFRAGSRRQPDNRSRKPLAPFTILSHFAIWAALGLIFLTSSPPAWAADLTKGEQVLEIPRVETPPALEDFLDMKPSRAWEGRLAKVGGFIQRLPSDGQPSTQRTDAYLGYDDQNIYCIFVAFDSEPHKMRAHKTIRDDLYGDERLDLFLDTYHDHRRAFVFTVNALGFQMDGTWTEGQPKQYDRSWDTVWHSRGKLTDRGFVVWVAVPFRSLRFPNVPDQDWGIVLIRWIPRTNESATWPWVSTRIEGRLNQGATLKGIKGISHSRNTQFIPYGFFRSYRALDTRDPTNPHFVTDNTDATAGLDAKFVLKDSFALDATVNPDFSQVESDEPQITINRRFEVFFPEKRPFFLENPSYFDTPINLYFTRRIADPQFGVRLTGKRGPWAVGALLADDEAPGKAVPPTDPLAGERAGVGIVRINRDLFRQSSIGGIFADRELNGGFNRVGGVDARFKLSRNWLLTGQGITSSTLLADGSSKAGPAYKVRLRRDGRQFYMDMDFNDRSPGFDSQTGFLAESSVERPMNGGRNFARPPLRPDIRGIGDFITYRFRPEGRHLISWGPNIFVNPIWDHAGNRLDMYSDLGVSWELAGATLIETYYIADQEMLRPRDFSALSENRTYSHHRSGIYFETAVDPRFGLNGQYTRGSIINYVPPAGQEPFLADLVRGGAGATFLPIKALRIQNSYTYEVLHDRQQGASIYNNHIIRSKWNWQFNRQLSFRTIFQYSTVLANPQFTSLETTRNFNADFLFTYLVNPWTAVYVGYNGNLQNLDLLPTTLGEQVFRTSYFTHDARQFFVKVSYLFRF
ncbi:MAG: DUF5916 domain-containing protein [Terriglobia bacterium]